MTRRKSRKRSRAVTFALHQSYTAMAYTILFGFLGTGVILAGYAIAVIDSQSGYPIITGIGGLVFYGLAVAQLKQWRRALDKAILISRAEAHERRYKNKPIIVVPDPDNLSDADIDRLGPMIDREDPEAPASPNA